MTLLTQRDYREYLIELKNRVYKILPLYEEENECLTEYIDSVCFELYGLKKLIAELPHGIWYVKSLATLEQMKVETLVVGHKKRVKKETFKVLKLIDNQIDVLPIETMKGE